MSKTIAEIVRAIADGQEIQISSIKYVGTTEDIVVKAVKTFAKGAPIGQPLPIIREARITARELIEFGLESCFASAVIRTRESVKEEQKKRGL